MLPRRIHAILDVLACAFAVLAIWHLAHKPDLPTAVPPSGRLIVNGELLRDADEIEFFLNRFRVGDQVHVSSDPSSPPVVVMLAPQDTLATAFDAFVAFVIIGVGLYVFVCRPEEKAARIFHLAALSTAVAVAGTKTVFWTGPPLVGIAMCAMFFICYTIVPVLFLHFTFVFPSVRWGGYRRLLVGLYAAGSAITLWSGLLYMQAASAGSIGLYRGFAVSSQVQNGFAVALFVCGIANFIVAYLKADETSGRKKIRWLLYGLSIGPAPFVLLWGLPEAFGSPPWISEWMFQLVLLLVPATFAISILRYRLMDIDILINRSVVYAVVVGAGIAVYLLILLLATRLVVSLTSEASLVAATGAAAVLALGFEPAKRKVQEYVDRKFFRVQYDFRSSLRRLTEEMRQCLDFSQIAEALVRHIDPLILAERIGCFTLQRPGPILRLVANRGFDPLAKHGVHFEDEKLRSALRLPVALDEWTEPGVEHETADGEVFRRWGMALVFPIRAERSGVLGFLVLGAKKSGLRFSVEDVDLLAAMVTQAGIAMERITLQTNLLLEHAETERLEELSRLKSYFVSSVSHDLKTPLTSIRMFAEILRQRKEVASPEAAEYLEIIEGESDRLTRLINNVLDFAKIERGIKEYHVLETDLNEIVERALCPLRYQFRMGSFRVEVKLAPGVITFRADPDAITEALVNLLSNAMKYSGSRKEIEISTFLSGENAAVRVSDCGIGISAEELPHIFEPFRRAKETRELGVGGAGLGLALVNEIVGAHGGKIEVESTPGRGTAFTLLFPVAREPVVAHTEGAA